MADKCIGKLTLDTTGVKKAVDDVNKMLEALGVGKKINISSRVTAAVKESLKDVEKLLADSEKKITDSANKAVQAINNIGKTKIQDNASLKEAISLWRDYYNTLTKAEKAYQSGDSIGGDKLRRDAEGIRQRAEALKAEAEVTDRVAAARKRYEEAYAASGSKDRFSQENASLKEAVTLWNDYYNTLTKAEKAYRSGDTTGGDKLRKDAENIRAKAEALKAEAEVTNEVAAARKRYEEAYAETGNKARLTSANEDAKQEAEIVRSLIDLYKQYYDLKTKQVNATNNADVDMYRASAEAVREEIAAITSENPALAQLAESHNEVAAAIQRQISAQNQSHEKSAQAFSQDEADRIDKYATALSNLYNEQAKFNNAKLVEGSREYEAAAEKVRHFEEAAVSAGSKLDETGIKTANSMQKVQTAVDNLVQSQARLGDSAQTNYLQTTENAYKQLTLAIKEYSVAKKAGNEEMMGYWDNQINGAMNTLSAIEQIVPSLQLEEGERTRILDLISAARTQQDGMQKGVVGTTQATGELDSAVNSIVTRYLSLFAVIRTINSLVDNMVEYVSEYADKMNEIQMITLSSNEEVAKLGETYRNIAKDMSVSSLDMAEAAVYFTRQGLEAADIEDRLKNVTMYAKAANVEFKDASEIITAVINSMNLVEQEAEDGRTAAQRVADVFLAIGDNAATSGQEIGEAMQKAAASAGSFGVSMEWLASYIATVSETTRQEARTIGTAFNTIIARLHQIKQTGYNQEDETKINDIAKALSKIDVALLNQDGNWRKMEDILQDVAAEWSDLDDKTKSYIATTMAGVKQQNVFLALMNDMAKGAEDGSRAFELYNIAMDSNGASADKYAIYLDSVTAAQERLTIAQENFYAILSADVIKGWYDTLANIINFITGATDAMDGMNIVLPLVAGGVALVAVAVVNLNKQIATTGGLIAVISKHPIIATITAVAGAIAVLTLGVGMFTNTSDNMREKFDAANKTLDESQQKISNLKSVQEGAKTMFGELGEKVSVTAEDLEKYNGLLEELSKVSPNAKLIVDQLKDGFISQEEAARQLNEELEALIENEKKVSMNALFDRYANYQNNGSDIFAIAETMGEDWINHAVEWSGESPFTIALRERYSLGDLSDEITEMISDLIDEFDELDYEYEEAWKRISERVSKELFGTFEIPDDLSDRLADQVNKEIEYAMTIVGQNLDLDSIQKSSLRRDLFDAIFGEDGELSFDEYDNFAETLARWIDDITNNGIENLDISGLDQIVSFISDIWDEMGQELSDDMIESITESFEDYDIAEEFMNSLSSILDAGYTTEDIYKTLFGTTVDNWSDAIDMFTENIKTSLIENLAGVVNEEDFGAAWLESFSSIIDRMTLDELKEMGDIINSLYASNTSSEVIKNIVMENEGVEDLISSLRNLIVVQEQVNEDTNNDTSASIDKLVKDIKAYSAEIDKLDGYIKTLQEGGNLSTDDILGLATAHPEIIRFIDNTERLIKVIQNYKDEVSDLNHQSIVDFLKDSKDFYANSGLQNEYLGEFETVQELLNSLEYGSKEYNVVMQYLNDSATKLEDASEKAREAAKNAEDTTSADKTLEEYLKQYEEYTKMIQSLDKGEGVDFTDLIGLATEDVSIIDAAGKSIDALRMKIAELREAAGAGIAESIKNMVMNSEKYLASSPLATYMEFGYKSLSDLEKDAGKFDANIEQQIKAYVAKVEAILLSESKQLGSVGKDIIGQLMTDMFSDSNVDLLNRPIVKMGEDFATVLTETLTAGTEGLEWSHDVVINLTPILPDGSELSYEEIEEYVQSLLDESNGISELFENDKVENGGKGILISVAAASEGFEEAISNAESLAEVLHILQEAYYGVTESEKTWLQAQAEEISRQEDLNWASTNGYAEQIYALQEALSSGGASGVMDEWNAMWDESNGKMNEAISNTYPNLINALAEVESALAAKNQMVESGTATTEELQQAEDDLAQAQSNLARELQTTNEYLDATHFTETANAAKQLREGTISVTEAYAKYNKDLNNVAKAQQEIINGQANLQKNTKITTNDVQNLASVLGMSTEEVAENFPEAVKLFDELTGATGELKAQLDALNEAAFIRITGTAEADFSEITSGLLIVKSMAQEAVEELLKTGQWELEELELPQEGLAFNPLTGKWHREWATAHAKVLKYKGSPATPTVSGGGGGSSGGGGGGGGGGGSEDSYDQKILDEMDKVDKFYKSQLEYFEALEKYYDSAGLTQGVIKSLERQREVLEEENKALGENIDMVKERLDLKKEELSTLAQGSDAYNACASDVEALEDAYRSMSTEQLNNISTMNALTDSIRAQQNAIRDLQIEIQNEIYSAIEDRERRADDMLNGRVDAENMIMDIVKSRYEAERDALLEAAKEESSSSGGGGGGGSSGYEDQIELLREKRDQIKENAKLTLDGLKEEYDAFQKNNKAQQDALKKEFDRISQIYKLRIDSLNEEKSLLNEQLNLRKQQYEMDDKATRLAELEAKYQRIIADPTRRKEALDIQKQIQSLRNEIAWDTAEEEVKSQQNDIDDEVKELNRELGLHKEKYEDQKDALTDALNAYKESYEEQKKLIEDTRDAQVKAIDEQIKALEKLAKAQSASSSSMASSSKSYTEQVKKYYDELFAHPAKLIQETSDILSGTDDEIIEWMKENDEEYKNASAARQEQMEKDWRETLRQMRGEQEDHWEEVEDIMAQGDEAIIQFLMNNSDGYKLAGTLQGQKYIEGWREKLKELGLMLEPVEVMPEIDFGTAPTVNPNQTGGSSSGGGSGGGGGGGGADTSPKSGIKFNGTGGANLGATLNFDDGKWYNINPSLNKSDLSVLGGNTKLAHSVRSDIDEESLGIFQMDKFASGGMADYTGPAWLDGSATMPERVLSPYQTELFETMVHALESASRINVQTAPNFENLQTTGSNVSVGDIIVNVDNLDTDDDYEELAEKVGEVLMDKLGRTSVVGGIRIRSI